MSATETPREPVDAPAPVPCPHCGAPVRPDQDWCLSCGAAVTTEVAGTPAWRAPIAIVGAVLLVAAVALAIAFAKLSSGDQQVAAAPTPAPTAALPAATPTVQPPAVTATPTPAPGTSATPVPAPPGSNPLPSVAPQPSVTPVVPGGTAAPGGRAIASWPAGRTAYTVIYWSATTHAEAVQKAHGFQASAHTVGILHSDDYSSLRAGYWVVFSGQYASDSAAQAAAQAAQGTAPGAYAKQVRPK
jgi:hypothetical protein